MHFFSKFSRVCPLYGMPNGIFYRGSHAKTWQPLISVCWRPNPVPNVPPVKNQQVRYLMRSLIQIPGTGINMPGQGLKKVDKTSLQEDKNDVVLQFIKRMEKEQEEGRKKLPLLPDYNLWLRLIKKIAFFCFLYILFGKDISELIVAVNEEPLIDSNMTSTAVQSFSVMVYTSLPFRIISRAYGRLSDIQLYSFLRPLVFGGYAKAFNVNMDEALVKDWKIYKSLSQFFSRPLDLAFRPVDINKALVSPCDGTILTCGEVQNGKVEQVKGITYSIQKFLGPLFETQTGDKQGLEKHTKVSLKEFQHSIMKDPKNNALFYCVIYLAPGDYHRFHSPVEWTMKYRRHFPGDLLSVNPKIATLVKDLFILNERVVLQGTWKHGFLSVSPVGATNVGSIKIYEDILLKTNRVRRKSGSFFDTKFSSDGYNLEKGELLGEFNLGSTIVLIFEAPKDTKLNLKSGQSIKFGQGIA